MLNRMHHLWRSFTGISNEDHIATYYKHPPPPHTHTHPHTYKHHYHLPSLANVTSNFFLFRSIWLLLLIMHRDMTKTSSKQTLFTMSNMRFVWMRQTKKTHTHFHWLGRVCWNYIFQLIRMAHILSTLQTRGRKKKTFNKMWVMHDDNNWRNAMQCNEHRKVYWAK